MQKIPISMSNQFRYYFDEMENLLSTVAVACLFTKYVAYLGKKRGTPFVFLQKISIPNPTVWLHIFDVHFALQSLCHLPAKIDIMSTNFKQYAIHQKKRIDFPRNNHPWIGMKVWASYTIGATFLHTAASILLIQKWMRSFFSKTTNVSLYFLRGAASLIGYTIEIIEKSRCGYDQFQNEIKQTNEKRAYEIPIGHAIDEEVASQWMPSDYRIKQAYRKGQTSADPILIHREKIKKKYQYDQVLLFLIICLKGIDMVKYARESKRILPRHLFPTSILKYTAPAHEMFVVALHAWTLFKHTHCDAILRELEG